MSPRITCRRLCTETTYGFSDGSSSCLTKNASKSDLIPIDDGLKFEAVLVHKEVTSSVGVKLRSRLTVPNQFLPYSWRQPRTCGRLHCRCIARSEFGRSLQRIFREIPDSIEGNVQSNRCVNQRSTGDCRWSIITSTVKPDLSLLNNSQILPLAYCPIVETDSLTLT